jgi:hypothetical protein
MRRSELGEFQPLLRRIGQRWVGQDIIHVTKDHFDCQHGRYSRFGAHQCDSSVKKGRLARRKAGPPLIAYNIRFE